MARPTALLIAATLLGTAVPAARAAGDLNVGYRGVIEARADNLAGGGTEAAGATCDVSVEPLGPEPGPALITANVAGLSTSNAWYSVGCVVIDFSDTEVAEIGQGPYQGTASGTRSEVWTVPGGPFTFCIRLYWTFSAPVGSGVEETCEPPADPRCEVAASGAGNAPAVNHDPCDPVPVAPVNLKKATTPVLFQPDAKVMFAVRVSDPDQGDNVTALVQVEDADRRVVDSFELSTVASGEVSRGQVTLADPPYEADRTYTWFVKAKDDHGVDSRYSKRVCGGRFTVVTA